jgi:aryl sulfotransferase
LLVHYEQLQKNLAGELRRIASFLGLPLSAAESQRLSALCDFELMRAHEAKFDHAAAEPGSQQLRPGSFIRRGASGEHRSVLSSAQHQRFSEHLLEPRRAQRVELNLPAFLH